MMMNGSGCVQEGEEIQNTCPPNGWEVKRFLASFGRTAARVFRIQRLGISLFQPPIALQRLFERRIQMVACGKSVVLPAMVYR